MCATQISTAKQEFAMEIDKENKDETNNRVYVSLADGVY